MAWTIAGGTALVGGALTASPVHIDGDRIAEEPASGARTLDAAGMLVLPGIVDIHGDGFERQVMPRPGVGFSLDIALHETDRQLVANGITTAFHGLTISWEPGLRSLESAERFVAGHARLRPQLACDTHLHFRWETFALDAIDAVCGWLETTPGAILAFNDHTTGSVEQAGAARRVGPWAQRAGLSIDAYRDLLDRVWQRRDGVPDAIAAVAGRARAAGATLLAHDEATPAARRDFRALGARSSEFPLTVETAQEARAAGEHVILGAPNVLRGGSHTGAMNAADAVADGLCSVLTSDYYYPAPMLAAFQLAADGRCALSDAWALVSANPAIAAGLADRGVLAPGRRADVVVVDKSGPGLPAVRASFVGGRKVYEA